MKATRLRLFEIILVLSVVLMGCSINNSSNIREKYTPVEVFAADSDACPQICWMGIKPNTTTKDFALQQLEKSDLVMQASLEQSDDEIEATWFTDTSKSITGYAFLKFSDGIVESIALRQLTPFTVGDIVDIFGSPEEIGVAAWHGQHGEKFTTYTLYYISLNSMVQVATGNESGPNPNDLVDWIGLNLVLDEGTLRQPWLGYEHLNDYLEPTSIP